MATAPFPFHTASTPFLPATTYPPPIFPGGCYTSPLPFSYAATYPYSPPACAYAPLPSFFPTPTSAQPAVASLPRPGLDPVGFFLSQPPPARNPPIPNLSTPSMATSPTPTSFLACGYSTAPAAFSFPCSQAPPSESTAPPTPAPPPTAAPSLSATPETALLRHPDQVPSAHLAFGRSSPTTRLLDAQDGNGPNRERRPPQCRTSSTSVLHLATPNSMCQGDYLIEGNGAGGESISNGKFVQGQARLEQQQACDRTSFDAIQGQLAKLSSMLSQFAVSLGKQSTSADASKPEQSQHISIVPAPPAHVAPQVFAEMPTPRSVYENFPGHPTQSSIVEGANTNFSEQNLDGMPQSYGFHNFNRQSIVLSDGTEHSYYALPDTRPLEQAAPETIFDVYDDESSVCSNESAHVFTGTPEQHTYEEIQQEGEQEPKCTSKPSEFTLSDNDDVYGATYIKFRHGQCIREISGLDFSPGCALGDEANKWNMLLTEEGREDWDPGILKTIMVVPPVVKWFSLEDVMPTHVPHVFVDVSIKCSERNSKTKLPSLPDSELCGKHWKRQHGNNPQRFMLTTEVRRKEWDPGILNQMDMMLVFSATGMEGPKNHLANQELRDNTSTKVAALTWHSSLPGTPFILILSSSTYTWDPGVLTMIGMMLDKYAMSHECQFIHWSAEFLALSSTACMQYVPHSGMYSVLHATCFLLQRVAHLSQGNCLCSLYCNSVLNTEYCIERMQWDPGVEMSLHCWLVVLTA